VARPGDAYEVAADTHNMAQARRVSDECIFMLLGELIEHRGTEDLFLVPQVARGETGSAAHCSGMASASPRRGSVSPRVITGAGPSPAPLSDINRQKSR
jgi:hypothetical protein